MNKDTIVDSEWFDYIKVGTKTIEGRPGNKVFYTGPITFINKQTKERLDCVIVDIIQYPTFSDLINVYGLGKVLPTCVSKSVDQAVRDVYYQINAGQPDSYESLEKKYGVQALVLTHQFK